jgi:L-seryl-tRNA(Ser) seleniumtransferase
MSGNKKSNNRLRNIPSVHVVLDNAGIKKLIQAHGRELITYAVRIIIKQLRKGILDGRKTGNVKSGSLEEIVKNTALFVKELTGESLKPVINATGIILHTNLGRAPLGEMVVKDINTIVTGYSNLEYDLHKAARSNRNIHIAELIKYLTSAEDALVVNNNAAGIYLVLHTLALDREVIISRGELIEIGGSFRIPEIMDASGVKMIEVGTTNKTRLEDYKAAMTDQTALVFKAHKSNFTITGFTEEASVKDLSHLAHTYHLPLVYDIGSGLLQKPGGIPLGNEPDVRSSIAQGADLVTFSCDKLLGGPQAGIVAGRGDLTAQLKSAPLMRVLRVGKLTLAALSRVCRNYLDPGKLVADTPVFTMLNRKEEYLYELAQTLQMKCEKFGISTRLVQSSGQCGGGTLPDLVLKSYAVEIIPRDIKCNQNLSFIEVIFKKLMYLNPPVIGILREGKLLFDVLTVLEADIDYIAHSISEAVHSLMEDPHQEEPY